MEELHMGPGRTQETCRASYKQYEEDGTQLGQYGSSS